MTSADDGYDGTVVEDDVMTSVRMEKLARREELSQMSGRSKDTLVKQEMADIKKVDL